MNVIKKILKYIEIPNTPYALPTKLFQNKEGEYTWEDFYDNAKKKYPVRYFLSKSVPDVAYSVYYFFDHLWYWFMSHTFKRQHYLDLRQRTKNKKSLDYYRWGFLNPNEKILYALFNILVTHVEDVNSNNFSYNFTQKGIDQQIKDGVYEEQINYYKNVIKLYDYWTVVRPKQIEKYDTLLNNWYKFATNSTEIKENILKENTLKEELNLFEIEMNEMESKMLHLLIDIRGAMWT